MSLKVYATFYNRINFLLGQVLYNMVRSLLDLRIFSVRLNPTRTYFSERKFWIDCFRTAVEKIDVMIEIYEKYNLNVCFVPYKFIFDYGISRILIFYEKSNRKKY